MKSTCKNCQWWVKGEFYEYGSCHKRSPIPITILTNSTEFGRRKEESYGFPDTDPENFCGDHKKKPEGDKK